MIVCVIFVLQAITLVELCKLRVVETEYGPVQGIHKTTILGRDFFSFQSIPYMAAPVGKLRFRDPQPPNRWTTVLDATKEPPSYPCIDVFTLNLTGQEDAAVINVFTPYIEPSRKLPVLVWIHGGSFEGFSSKTDVFGPDYLLQKDVVVVTFNYRYGIIGFLSLNDPKVDIPGNVGLKDQNLALKWVKNNIARFGGDPNEVTVFGESAGAASVHLHMLSDQSKNLFKRAILMSGTAFNPWVFPTFPNYAQALAKQMGFNGTSDAQILKFLENCSPFDFIIAKNLIVKQQREFGRFEDIVVGPVVEPYWSKNAFISKNTTAAARIAWSNKIDVIISGNSFEGLFQAYKEYTENIELYISFFNKNSALFVPIGELKLDPSSQQAKTYGHEVRDLYFDSSENVTVKNLNSLYKFISDLEFNQPNYRLLKSRLKYGSGKTYMSRFDGDTSLNLFKLMIARKPLVHGASHADDLFYYFKSIYVNPPGISSVEFELVKTMVELITSFAISGTPKISEETVWNVAFDSDDPPMVMNIANSKISMIPMPEFNNIKVFNKIFESASVDLI